MTLPELKEKLKYKLNKPVYLMKPHVWAGEKGITVDIEILVDKPAMIVELDNGNRCAVFDPKELHYLPE